MSRQVVGAVVAAAVTTIMVMVVIDRDDTRFIGFPVNIASAASGSMPSTTAHVYVHWRKRHLYLCYKTRWAMMDLFDREKKANIESTDSVRRRHQPMQTNTEDTVWESKELKNKTREH